MIDKNAMVAYVRSLGIDPNQVSVLTQDNERTVYTSVSQATDEGALLDFLESQGVDTTGVAVVELTKDEAIVTRVAYDKHGQPRYTLGLKGVQLVFETEVVEIG